jgi:hypothetical protein
MRAQLYGICARLPAFFSSQADSGPFQHRFQATKEMEIGLA